MFPQNYQCKSLLLVSELVPDLVFFSPQSFNVLVSFWRWWWFV